MLGLVAGMLATWVDVDTPPRASPSSPPQPLAQPSSPAAPPAAWDARSDHEDLVEIEVLVIRATKATDTVDPELEPLIENLRFTRYRGFALRDRHAAELGEDGALRFAIDGGRSVEVILLAHDGVDAHVRMQMWGAGGSKLLDTTVRIRRGRSFLVAGPKVGDDVLVLPLRVRW